LGGVRRDVFVGGLDADLHDRWPPLARARDGGEAVADDRALLGVVAIIKHRPELVRGLGRETDSRLAKHRQRSLERYHLQ